MGLTSPEIAVWRAVMPLCFDRRRGSSAKNRINPMRPWRQWKKEECGWDVAALKSEENDAEIGAPPYPSAFSAWYMVAILILAYTFSFIDRQILTLLVHDIQADLKVNDTAMGVLHGFTFAVFYSVAGLPIARAIDIGPRRSILAVGIFVWSLTTALCGLASHYWQLLMLRIGVAVGEATLLPAMNSLIGDTFPPERRGLATAMFNVGLPVGIGLSVLFGGVLINSFEGVTLTVPGVGTLKPWQLVFLSVGLPGILVAGLVMTMMDPPRRQVSAQGDTSIPIRDVVAHLFRYRSAFGWHFLAVCFASMVGYGYIAWIPAMYIRNFDISSGDMGIVYGVITIVFGVSSIIIAGWFSDYWDAKGNVDGKMRAPLIAVTASLIPALIFPLMTNIYLSFFFLGVFLFFSYGIWATGAAVIQDLSPGPMRAQITAIYTGILNLVGLGCGPVGIALLTDYAFGDPKAVKYSMIIFALFGTLIAMGAWVVCLRPYRVFARRLRTWKPAPS